MRLAYDDVGRGDCVVLIHGHPFDRTLWEPQLAGLRDGFRVIAPDLRGFGRRLCRRGHRHAGERLLCLGRFTVGY